MNQQATDKKRNVKSNGTAGPRSQRSSHQGGAGRAGPERATPPEKGPGAAAVVTAATNSAVPSSHATRGANTTTGTVNSGSIISNSNNTPSSNLNSGSSSNTSSNDVGGGINAATRSSDVARDRIDGPASPAVAQATTTGGSTPSGTPAIPSLNSVGSCVSRDGPYASAAPGSTQGQGPEGVYNNARFMHAVAALVGHTVEVRVRGEKDTYEGLFHTLSPGLEIALDGVLVGSPDRERNSPDGRGDSLIDSVSAAQSAPGHLAGLVRNMERLKNADSSDQPLQETMVFSLKDVISVTAYNIDMDYATKDANAFTDAAISRSTNGRPVERDLQAWSDDGPEGKSIEEGQLEDMSRATSWDPEEMFKTNKSKFGVETTYRDNLEGYTYQYEQRNDDPEFQRREAEAVRIAMEIESNVQHKRNNELEIGCDGDDEELKYSAVVKESRNDARGSYAHATNRRNKQSAPNANGSQPKGGSQQRGVSHPSHHNASANPGQREQRGPHVRSTNSPTSLAAPHTAVPSHQVAASCSGPTRPAPTGVRDESRRGANERSSSAARTSPPPKLQPAPPPPPPQQQDKLREDKGSAPSVVAHGTPVPQPSPTQQQPPPVSQIPLQSVPPQAVLEGKRTPPLASVAGTPCVPPPSQPPTSEQQPAGQQTPPSGVLSSGPPPDAAKTESTIVGPPRTPSLAPTTPSSTAVSTSTEEIVKKSTLNPNAAEFVFNPKTSHVTQTTMTHSKQSTPPATMVPHTGGHPLPNRQPPIMVPQHLIIPGPSVFQTFPGPQPGHGPPPHGHGGAHQAGAPGGHQGGRNQFGRGNKGGNRQNVDQTMHVTGAPLVTGSPGGQPQQVVLGYPPPHFGPTPPGGVPPVTVMQSQIAMQHGQQVQVVNYNPLVQARGVMSPPAGPGVGGLGSPSMVGPIHQGEYQTTALHIGHPQQVFLRDQPTQLVYQGFEGAPGQAVAFVVQPQPPGGGQSGAPTPNSGGVGGPHGGPHGQQPLLAYPGQQWGQPMLLMSPINPSGGAPTPPPHHAPHMNMAVMPGPPPLGPPHGGPHAPPHGPPFAPQTVVPPGPPVPPNAIPVPPGVPQVVGGAPGVGGPPPSAGGAPNGPANQPPPAPPAGAQQGPPPLAAPQQPPPQPQGV